MPLGPAGLLRIVRRESESPRRARKEAFEKKFLFEGKGAAHFVKQQEKGKISCLARRSNPI
jgi:hypothetical protein